MTYLLYIVNIMFADGLEAQGAMALPNMVFVMLNRIDSVHTI